MTIANWTPLRVGLIGYGFAGKTFHAPLIQATDGLTLGAVASSDAARVHRDLPHAEVFAGAAQLIASDAIDLVVIASPNATHACSIAMQNTPLARAYAYRAWLRQGVSDDEPIAIRQHLQQERTFGSKRCQAMAEKTPGRPVNFRPPGRPGRAETRPAGI